MKFVLRLLFIFHALVGQYSFAQEILISNNVPQYQKNKIEDDFNFLKNINHINSDEALLSLLNSDKLDGTILMNWLSERIHFVLTKSDADLSNFYVIKRNVEYPNANVIPYSQQASIHTYIEVEKTQSDVISYTMATNMAPAVYQYGKGVKKVYAIDVKVGSNIWQAAITTPRAGIMAIEEGLFHPAYTINKNDNNAISDRIYRLSTFFHEARHSDGSNESIGFAHASCPKGHNYEGMSACDENLNGPYTFGAEFMKNLTEEYVNELSNSEKEQLKIIQLDTIYRVLKTTHKNDLSKHWDDTPEEVSLDN